MIKSSFSDPLEDTIYARQREIHTGNWAIFVYELPEQLIYAYSFSVAQI